MKSILKGINKKDATLLLRALINHSNAYYYYNNGKEYDPFKNIDSLNDSIHNLTVKLAKKIGLRED